MEMKYWKKAVMGLNIISAIFNIFNAVIPERRHVERESLTLLRLCVELLLFSDMDL